MFAMSSTGCSRFYQEAVVSADMRCISLSEGKQIERKMDFLKKLCINQIGTGGIA